MTPRISVIVPVRDGEDQLPGLIRALERQTMPRQDFEVLVAVNDTRDRSAEVAARLGARVTEDRRPGRARARNRAAEIARGETLAFTDADCLPDPGWVEALLRGLEGAGLAAGPVRLMTGSPPNAIERLESLWRFDQERSVREEGWSVTANLAMTRSAFDAIGGFDESFRHIGEDVDLCLRAGAAGYAISWCPDAVVAHPAENRLRPMLRRAAAQAHSEYQMSLVHGRHEGAHWRHPGPAVRGDWALRHFGIDPDQLDPAERQQVVRAARREWAGRMAGSLWARLTLRGPIAAVSRRRSRPRAARRSRPAS